MCYTLTLLEIALGQARRFFGTRRDFGVYPERPTCEITEPLHATSPRVVAEMNDYKEKNWLVVQFGQDPLSFGMTNPLSPLSVIPSARNLS
jgi:hypothetical protein